MKRFTILGKQVDSYIMENMDEYILHDEMDSAILLIEKEISCSVVLARRFVYEWIDECYG